MGDLPVELEQSPWRLGWALSRHFLAHPAPAVLQFALPAVASVIATRTMGADVLTAGGGGLALLIAIGLWFVVNVIVFGIAVIVALVRQRTMAIRELRSRFAADPVARVLEELRQDTVVIYGQEVDLARVVQVVAPELAKGWRVGGWASIDLGQAMGLPDPDPESAMRDPTDEVHSSKAQDTPSADIAGRLGLLGVVELELLPPSSDRSFTAWGRGTHIVRPTELGRAVILRLQREVGRDA